MKFEIYRDTSRKREWRWRLRAKNGRIIANSGEGYKRLQGCEDAIDLIRENCPSIPVWGGKAERAAIR